MSPTHYINHGRNELMRVDACILVRLIDVLVHRSHGAKTNL